MFRTVTRNDELVAFPATSVALHVTVVWPSANVAPLVAEHEATTPGMLSAATGAANVTTAPAELVASAT